MAVVLYTETFFTSVNMDSLTHRCIYTYMYIHIDVYIVYTVAMVPKVRYNDHR